MPDPLEKFYPDLYDSFGPSTLLRLEGAYLNRQLRGHIIVSQVNKMPTHQLRTVRKIGVLGQSVVLPAAGPLDRFAAPHARGAVEVEEPAAAITRYLFDDEVTVEHDRLNPGQQRVVRVDMAPAHLHHSGSLIGEVIDHSPNAIGPRRKVRIEDQDELAGSFLEPGLQRAGLEALAVFAM